MITASQLRQKYLDFFKQQGHAIIPSAPLIPENDPSVLFTTAGMHPLVPFLMGEKHPAGSRLADVQKCIRTVDIDEVGDNTHLTFFEMLGNWSLGDYFKTDTIRWSYDFLTNPDWLGLEVQKLAVSVFAGDDDAPFDQEAYDTWRQLGIADERIARLGKADNWWPAGGKHPGPQGPDTEMFYWTGEGPAPAAFDPEDDRWVEIWNDVFMQYNKTDDGVFEPLAQQNVDTGMGLERVLAVMQGKASVYETDLFQPLMTAVLQMANATDHAEAFLAEHGNAVRIIVDHIRTAVFILGDPIGVVPSNSEQGYILRRLIRRAIRHAKRIGVPQDVALTTRLAELVIEMFGQTYTELQDNQQRIIDELTKEEEKFERTLEKGLKEFEKMADNGEVSGREAFILFSTYGFPLELTQELATERGFAFNDGEFRAEFAKHQDLSRTASAGMFKGGLADTSEMSVKYHTATHLLHAALRQVLGEHVEQRGSNITAKRLRFDFAHPEKMTDEQKQQVTELVNAAIAADYPVSFAEMSVDKAKAKGAMGLFGDKYGETVKVYSIGDADQPAVADPTAPTFSREICGGPHVTRTGELGTFKITKEEASSAGVRRIKAVLE